MEYVRELKTETHLNFILVGIVKAALEEAKIAITEVSQICSITLSYSTLAAAYDPLSMPQNWRGSGSGAFACMIMDGGYGSIHKCPIILADVEDMQIVVRVENGWGISLQLLTVFPTRKYVWRLRYDIKSV